MKNILRKIKASFKRAMRGEEKIDYIIWRFGAVFYVSAIFIIDKLIKKVDIIYLDMSLAALAVTYAIWHLYVLIKCKPKKPKLSKAEKKELKAKARKDLGKKFLRKLFLQEPLTKTNPIFLTAVIDLFFISHFLGYML